MEGSDEKIATAFHHSINQIKRIFKKQQTQKNQQTLAFQTR